MFEIWWRDRLLDVVPAVADVPEMLTVRSRSVGVVERVAAAPPDWRFTKVLVIALMLFTATALVLRLTPVGEGGQDDGLFQHGDITRLILPRQPPKVIPRVGKIIDAKVKQVFANGHSHTPSKAKLSSMLALWDDGMRGLGGGGLSDRIDAALRGLGGGPVSADALGPGLGGGGGPRGGGPGMGPGFGIGGTGARPGGRPGGASLGPKGDDGPSSGPIKITDGLPRDLVAKVIRAHHNEIKYCYDRELQRDTALSGKVTVAFTIGPAGEVLEALIAESTLENSSVEQCMLDRVKRWRFPEPRGGGTVDVTHPWVFRAAGDNDP